MPNNKKSSPKRKKAANPPQAKTLSLSRKIRKEIGQVLQAQAARLRELDDDTTRDRVLGELVENAVSRKSSRANDGSLPDSCLEAIYKEFASGIRSTSQREKVAYLGPLHSYSHLAALRRFGTSSELVAVRTIAAVFEEVTSGQADSGVVPIENSTDGRIVDTLDMFTRCRVKICGEVPLRIHHNLLGSGRRDQIREVQSKPQAISQCREWLAHHLPDVTLTHTSSTTVAAERASKDSSVAAIASQQAGVEYGLRVLAKHIEDNPENITRFAVLAKEPASKTGDDKTALMFELPHQPGALADAMVIFKRHRLNLTWIESFPKPGSPKEYLFFVELLGHQQDLRVRKALASLAKKTVTLEVLGAYPVVPPVD